jgi:putative membrane protein
MLLLVLAVVGSSALFTERWWGYRLTRESDGTLRVHRGLLTRRSLSVSEHRLRGVLQPPAPRAEAHRIAAAALQEPAAPTSTPLLRHPRVALRRRMTRALGPAAVLALAAWVLAGTTGPAGLGPLSLLLLPAAALLGWDRYRGLGHALTPRYLVSRLGGLNRRTVVLRREGVIGWTVRQSPFQRRAGVVTLEAVTAAGEGGYRILDLTATDAAALAEAVTPEVRAFGARAR